MPAPQFAPKPMNDPASAVKSHRRVSWKRRVLLFAFVVGLVCFVLSVHPFLALNRPVKADTMIVEGWVPDYAIANAVHEFKSGQYVRIFVSGFDVETANSDSTDASGTSRVVQNLIGMGIPTAAVESCPAPPSAFNRTSHMARAVRDRMRVLNVNPLGTNVVTLGPHGRQSLLAYRRMLGSTTPVGVITIPKNDYNPSYWWASSSGIKKTTKDFAGWVKEVIFGLRS
jgi:hypothetical protein